MSPDENTPLDQDSLSSPDAGSQELAEQVAQLIRLVRSGEEANIELAFLISKGLGNPAPFGQYLQDLLPLYKLAFESKRKKLDTAALAELFGLTEFAISERELTELPENLGQLQNLLELDCDYNQLQSLPESLAVLPKLKKLDARNNPLTHIPTALRQKQGLELLVDEPK